MTNITIYGTQCWGLNSLQQMLGKTRIQL